MASFIGIDLGTTYSAVGTIDETGRPIIVHNANGQNITPSCVSENDEGVMEVGDIAKRVWGSTQGKAAGRFKRNMGKTECLCNDEKKECETHYSINDKKFTPTELSAFVLKKLVKDASEIVGPVEQVVVTVPANFPSDAREATMDAAKAAGLDVQYVIDEPTAAALHYAFKSGGGLHGTYAVYDLGGGTFDVSIIRVEGQDVEVVASNGVQKLGGTDFDQALIEIVSRKYKEATGEDMEPDDFTKNEAEEEKKSLSQRKRVTTKVARQLIEITREEFEEAISSKVAQAEILCEATLEEAKVDLSEIRDVLLAGGATRIPMVRASVERVFKREPVSSVNVDEVVALGAALWAAYKGDHSKLSAVQRNAIQKIKISESTGKCFGTISLSVDSARDKPQAQNSILIKKGEKIPCSVTESFYTVHDGQTGVECILTECIHPESDPKFVNKVWEGNLSLPSGRPANQEIAVTFSYDENQIMKCSFVDVATGARTDVDFDPSDGSDGSSGSAASIDRFLVE